MTELAQRDLLPPRGGTTIPLGGEELVAYLDLLGSQWHVADEQRLETEFSFNDFQGALDFTNRVGALAESVDHHPEIILSWG